MTYGIELESNYSTTYTPQCECDGTITSSLPTTTNHGITKSTMDNTRPTGPATNQPPSLPPDAYVTAWCRHLFPQPPPSHVSDPRTHVSSAVASGLTNMPSSASLNVFGMAPGQQQAQSNVLPLDSQNQSQLDPALRYEGVPTDEQLRKLRGEMSAMGNEIAELKRALEGQAPSTSSTRRRTGRYILGGSAELLENDEIEVREALIVSTVLFRMEWHTLALVRERSHITSSSRLVFIHEPMQLRPNGAQ